VVSRRELLPAGISAKELERRLGAGALIAVFRGVYRVGHTAPSREAHHLAAVRACGDGALLSGRAAAHLLGLRKGAAPPPEVTAATDRRVKGVRTRRAHRQATQSAARRRQRHPQHARARLSRPAAQRAPAPTEDKPARRRATAGLHTRHAWEQDRHREREAHARGHDFRRYTYGDVLENPALMLAELTALLTRAASPPGPTGAEASSAPRSSTSVWKR